MDQTFKEYVATSLSGLKHPTITQRVLIVVSLVIAALTVCEITLYPAQYGVTTLLSIIQVFAILMIPLMPYPMGCIGCSVAIIAMLIPDQSGASMLTGLWESLFCIGYCSRKIINLLWPITVIIVRLWFSWSRHLQPGDYMFLLTIFALCYAAGSLLRQRQTLALSNHNALLHKQAEQRVAFEHRINTAASLIHDSITNNLVCSILLLDDLTPKVDNHSICRTLSLLHDQSSQTLKRVHEAIRILDGDESAIAAEENRNFISTIREQIHEGDQYLASLGFVGSTHIHVKADYIEIPSDLSRSILSLVRELYTNIVIHALPNSLYDVRINVGINHFSLDEINTIGDTTLLPNKPASRHGLNLHRGLIEEHGGSIRTSKEDGAWMLHAEVGWVPTSNITD